MEPKLISLEKMDVMGIEVRTTNQEEMAPTRARIPGLWGRFYSEKLSETILGKKPGGMPIGVYSKYETNHTGPYSLLAGLEVSSLDALPEGLSKVSVSSGKYLVFTAQGPMPQTLIQTWIAIGNYFSKGSKYKRAYTTDFEMYRGSETVDIHIAIQ
jgi:predicted transcriptional regulator YdeE